MIVHIIKSLGSLLFCVTNQEKKLAQLLVEICCFFFLMKFLVFPSRERERERERVTLALKKEKVALHLKKREKTGKEKVIPKLKTKNIRSFKSICVFYQQKKNQFV